MIFSGDARQRALRFPWGTFDYLIPKYHRSPPFARNFSRKSTEIIKFGRAGKPWDPFLCNSPAPTAKTRAIAFFFAESEKMPLSGGAGTCYNDRNNSTRRAYHGSDFTTDCPIGGSLPGNSGPGPPQPGPDQPGSGRPHPENCRGAGLPPQLHRAGPGSGPAGVSSGRHSPVCGDAHHAGRGRRRPSGGSGTTGLRSGN